MAACERIECWGREHGGKGLEKKVTEGKKRWKERVCTKAGVIEGNIKSGR